MQVQSGTSDFGLFAIATAVEIATNGLDRSIKSMRRTPWSQSAMREHLATCLKNKMITPFPQCLNRPAALSETVPLCRSQLMSRKVRMCSVVTFGSREV